MLRALFGEPPREWEGHPLDTVQTIERFARLMHEKGAGEAGAAVRYRRYAILAEGLLRSMDELEQSKYAARRYALKMTKTSVDEMSSAERLDYYRHVYYDKNTYIRLFSLLDKLGMLLNEMLGLRTEKIKAHFSYFTVLRTMRAHGPHAHLAERLAEWKEKHQDALNRLRNRRNTEIHHMNAELQDDLLHSLNSDEGTARLENIEANMRDLEAGWEMACRTLDLSFRYLLKTGRGPAHDG
ncbi:Cthe_2314 family HEPN domain-containing protein [Cohnella thermotolerans]|uniref:Cthe_2314 family HEPN domain-containing protein n=1 Tax=Cohnella thermotolerans TaxID=329858 RepID=UPI00040A09DA|nr:Cthe_2314 family HEPN domain-containing protein [Cohnella thermotolerans]